MCGVACEYKECGDGPQGCGITASWWQLLKVSIMVLHEKRSVCYYGILVAVGQQFLKLSVFGIVNIDIAVAPTNLLTHVSIYFYRGPYKHIYICIDTSLHIYVSIYIYICTYT